MERCLAVGNDIRGRASASFSSDGEGLERGELSWEGIVSFGMSENLAVNGEGWIVAVMVFSPDS